MAEVDERPRHAGCASDDGEDEEPGDEEDEDVGGPHPGVHEPLRVLVQIRRRHRLRVQLRHLLARLRLGVSSAAAAASVGGGENLGWAGGRRRDMRMGLRAAGLVRAGDSEGSFKDGSGKKLRGWR
jgi:hypothetical protein